MGEAQGQERGLLYQHLREGAGRRCEKAQCARHRLRPYPPRRDPRRSRRHLCQLRRLGRKLYGDCRASRRAARNHPLDRGAGATRNELHRRATGRVSTRMAWVRASARRFARNRLGAGPEIFRQFHQFLAKRGDIGRDPVELRADVGGAAKRAVRHAYAVWTGIGAAGSVLIGMILFKEPTDIIRILCLLFDCDRDRWHQTRDTGPLAAANRYFPSKVFLFACRHGLPALF